MVLPLAWAGTAGYLVPHLIRASDPGCMVYQDTALTAYNRVVDDVSRGAARDVLTRDLTSAIRQIDDAAADSRDTARHPLAARAIGWPADGAGRCPGGWLRTASWAGCADQDTERADDACGTLRI